VAEHVAAAGRDPSDRPSRRATYRLQLHRGFGFEAAASLCSYLRELGVSHLYCSPVLQAVEGSTHGYDVVDPTRLSGELGGDEGFVALRGALHDEGLALLLDVVPNHMAADAANRRWWDVLEDGERSEYASWFDVDWSGTLDPLMRGRVLLPVLGDHLGRAVERGELVVAQRRDARIVARYHDRVAPLSLETVHGLLHGAAAVSGSAVLSAVAHGAAHLPAERPARRLAREAVWDELRAACADDPDAAAAVAAQIDGVNLDAATVVALLDAQNYRMARWRVALTEANYRRFFDITSLIGVRVEDPQVFSATHALVLGLLRRGDLDGLRIDHVDGLRLPRAYLRRLRAEAGDDAWIVVEKILGADETLPHDWPVQGTTGYEFAALATRVLTDPRAEPPLSALLVAMGGTADVAAAVRSARLQVMEQTLAADVSRLVALLRRVCARRPRHGDHTAAELRVAVSELIAAMPVYRTYAEPGAPASAADEARVRSAVSALRALRHDVDGELLVMVADMVVDNAQRDGDDDATELVLRFQQVASAVMAKGVEDTAFYRLVALASLDEVGGGPLPFSASVEDFHAHNAVVQERWPETLLATTTHDIKRSEDVRARLALLSEMPEEWARAVLAWHDRNQRHCHGEWPDGVMEYLLYQTMVGAWPVERARLLDYMDKASREAKQHTSWIDPAPDYDRALRGFVEALYDDTEFIAEVDGFVRPLLAPGRVNALATALLKLTSPGVPDVYQGSELWTLSLVDPDNRRPVDYETRRLLLQRSRAVPAAAAWREEADSGLPKLLLTRRALLLRERQPRLFGAEGAYLPLQASGARAEHVIAFARGASPGAVTVVPRLVLGVGGAWGDTTVRLPEGDWFDQLCGRRFAGDAPVGELLGDFPVALLARVPFAER
jgi:(1->4)-alpha-D-glucan 1-alpha-D-glucosylmutase